MNVNALFNIAVCALAACLAACSHTTGTDAGTTVYEPRYASNFTITTPDSAGHPGDVIISTLSPWQGADGTVTRLFVSAEGNEPPDGFDGQVLRKIPQSVVTMSSSHVAMLDALGRIDDVKGVSGLGFITNEHIQGRKAEIADVGYDGNTNYEALAAIRPDLVLLYGTNGANTIEPKLRELGIPFMYVGEYIEESPLGKAEWLVPVAYALGDGARGIEVFADIPRRYEAVRQTYKNAKERPRVMLNTPYRDVWYMPSTDNYVARLIADAGGQYVYERNTSGASEAIDLETACILGAGADVWLNVGDATSLADMRRVCPQLADTPPMRTGRIYNTTARATAGGGNDYWESGVVRPDVVLRDMARIFHPGVEADSTLYYYKRLR